MAIVIKPKRSETADSAPGTSDIVDGEIAVNIADKKIYIRHSDDTIVTLSDGANLTSGSTSTIDATTDIILDADGGDIFFKDGGTTFGSATNTSGNLIVKSGTTTALTFSGANVTAAGTIDSGAITSTGVVTGTGFTIGSAAINETELEIIDGATVTTTELNLLDGGTSVGDSITIADADGFIVNDNGTMKSIPASDLKTYAGGSAPAADDIGTGDAAVNITTSSGNITIDAAANNSDIIFKGTDASSDITMLTLDGSEAGKAIFNSAITGGGLLTTGGNIVIPNAGNIGSAGDTDAIAIASDGVVTFSQNPVATLATAAQTNITSLGTLTALTVDDVNINGKVITMTGSSSDTAVFTAGTNGTLSIVTTDDAAAAANIQITADGTAELAGTTVTLDSSGGITLDADGGTITFADAGSSLGTITSDGFTGNVVGNVTGNASGTALTVTQAAQTAITSVGTLTALTVDDVVINGKVITMTGSSSDTAVFTVGTNGTLSIVTTDAAAAAANIQITADGTAELAGTTVTLDSSGGITLDADNGTITFADAGSSLGTITSDGYTGNVVGDVTGDVTGTADVATVATTVTITDNESTDEDNAIIFTAGGDVDGGNIGLESDGTLTYNPSTGKVTATGFVGTLTGNVTGNTSGTAATVTTAAQTNITSLGTLTALTVDDVAINGKVMTMTGSSSDTAVFTAGTNGTLSIVTTDAAAAAANITITADGTFEADGTTITLDSAGDVVLDAGGGDVFFKAGGTTFGSATNTSGNLIIKSGTTTAATFSGANVTLAGTVGSGAITSSGIIKTDDATDATSTTDGSLQTDGGLSVAKDVVTGNDVKLLSDAAVLSFGADSDVTLTHVADTGILLNSTMAIQFNDASQSINAPSNAILDINATDEIELNATLVDVNANLDVSGTVTSGGIVTGTGFTIGSAAINETELEIIDGATVTTTELNLLDGGTSVGDSITIADADGFIVNDNGTMKTIPASDVKTYAGGNPAADDIASGDAAVTITTSSGNITIDAAANNSDIIFKGTDASSDITMLTLDGSAAGAAIFNSAITGGGLLTTGGNIVIPDAGNIGSASDTDAISIGSDGDVTLTQDLELQHDGAILSFGANDEVTLTHVHNDGLLLNTDMQLQFRDSAINIRSDADGDLDINADDEIELNSTLVDVNANLDVSGTYTGGGTMTTGGNIVIPNAGNIGSVGDTDAIAIASDGVVTFSQVPVLPDNTVSTGDIQADAITEAKIADDAVESEHLNNNVISGQTEITSGLADADELLYSDGGTIKRVGLDTLTTHVASGVSKPASYNGIINGDFTAWQRGTAFRSGANNDDTCTASRWRVLSDGNDIVDVVRAGGLLDTSVTGGAPRYSLALDVETEDKKFGIVQIIEATNCSSLGIVGTATVSLSFLAKASNVSKLDNVKAAVIGWSGSADAVTSDVVAAWNSEGTDPTLATSWTYENTPANLNVTTSDVRYKIENISVDTGTTNNLAVFIWSDVTDTTAGHVLYITDVQLEPGATANDFKRESASETLSKCQRYYHRGLYTFITYSTSGCVFNINFPTTMRTSPTTSHEYPEGGTANDIYNLTNAGTPQFVPNGSFVDVNSYKFAYDFDAGLTANDGYQAYFYFEAEL